MWNSSKAKCFACRPDRLTLLKVGKLVVMWWMTLIDRYRDLGPTSPRHTKVSPQGKGLLPDQTESIQFTQFRGHNTGQADLELCPKPYSDGLEIEMEIFGRRWPPLVILMDVFGSVKHLSYSKTR